LDAEDGPRVETVGSQEEDKVGWCEVEVDVFEAQESCKQEAAVQYGRLLPRKDEGEHQYSVHEAIILEVHVVDNEKTGRQKD